MTVDHDGFSAAVLLRGKLGGKNIVIRVVRDDLQSAFLKMRHDGCRDFELIAGDRFFRGQELEEFFDRPA